MRQKYVYILITNQKLISDLSNTEMPINFFTEK